MNWSEKVNIIPEWRRPKQAGPLEEDATSSTAAESRRERDQLNPEGLPPTSSSTRAQQRAGSKKSFQEAAMRRRGGHGGIDQMEEKQDGSNKKGPSTPPPEPQQRTVPSPLKDLWPVSVAPTETNRVGSPPESHGDSATEDLVIDTVVHGSSRSTSRKEEEDGSGKEGQDGRPTGTKRASETPKAVHTLLHRDQGLWPPVQTTHQRVIDNVELVNFVRSDIRRLDRELKSEMFNCKLELRTLTDKTTTTSAKLDRTMAHVDAAPRMVQDGVEYMKTALNVATRSAQDCSTFVREISANIEWCKRSLELLQATTNEQIREITVNIVATLGRVEGAMMNFYQRPTPGHDINQGESRTIKKKAHCVLCNRDNHEAFECRTYTTHSDRRQKAVENLRCTKCLGPASHETCPEAKTQCDECRHLRQDPETEANHSAVLCPIRFSKENAAAKKAASRDRAMKRKHQGSKDINAFGVPKKQASATPTTSDYPFRGPGTI
ncbi:unnamed protein product [Caenorhabditis sp. 36 PRJEB53466]|nr:unnamed protein product [Caenorhabditis sp. 36 PRJEB53466]